MAHRKTDRRETWITGLGLVSSLGEGLEANWEALRSGRVNIEQERYAPWMIHPLAPLNLDSQIPKKGDQRQMEAWQRIGTYAAGLALDSAGIKDNKEILARTDMIVAAGGGERDLTVDDAILSARVRGDIPRRRGCIWRSCPQDSGLVQQVDDQTHPLCRRYHRGGVHSADAGAPANSAYHQLQCSGSGNPVRRRA
jgi:hypothetical protein